jgi:hypothetical protein
MANTSSAQAFNSRRNHTSWRASRRLRSLALLITAMAGFDDMEISS